MSHLWVRRPFLAVGYSSVLSRETAPLGNVWLAREESQGTTGTWLSQQAQKCIARPSACRTAAESRSRRAFQGGGWSEAAVRSLRSDCLSGLFQVSPEQGRPPSPP